MIEYEDGSLSEIMSKDEALTRAMKESTAKLVHIGTEFDLAKKREQTVGKAEAQLDRIEKMLSALITHFNIPYQGIVRA